jgi:hypothetical protein
MTRRIMQILLILGLGSGMPFVRNTAFSQSASEPKETIKVGFGISDITPTRPTPMAGYYGVRYSTATHDPLWAKATCIDDGSTQLK